MVEKSHHYWTSVIKAEKVVGSFILYEESLNEI